METSYLKTLELDKIIARASEGCVCKEAREQLLALEPQCDPDEVRYALEQTDAINSLLIKNGSPRFGGVEGVSSLVARAVKGGVLSMGELLMVAGALRNFQNLTSWYGSSEHDALPTDDLFYALAPQPGLEQQISSAILAPDAMADTASHTLNELRKKIRATENSIRDRLESMVRNMDTSKYLQESVVSIRNGRYVVPVKSEYRGEVSGIIHDVSSTGATVFVEPQAVVEANARILQYRAQEAQEIERILVAFTAQVAAIEPQFQYSYKAMLEIDVLLAKARLALDMKAFKPSVRTDSSFSLIRARHPLIDPQKCIPVDIALGKEYDSLIITGPNTGGKTVTLKTAGLLCAMAQCGFLIPADERSEICVFDEFLVDIGDEQSIEQSLSTFSAHMSNIVQILREVDDQSLLLFDELGAGTDPIEGAALAIAIIESARSQGALIAATTHYAELKTFAMTTAGVENASCEFDVQTLRPTYRLLIGIPGKSNAFAISRRLGLDESVIQAAQQQMDSDSVRFEDVLTQLEEKRQRLEKAQAEADRLWRQREEDARKARTFREQMEKAKDNARTKGEAEAKRIVRQAQAQADEIFAQLDQLRRQQQKQINFQELNDAKAAVRHSLNQAQEALHLRSEPQEPAYAPSRPIEVGDLVELPGVKMAASVLAVNNDGTLLLQAGKMKMTVKAQQVRLPEGQPKKKPAAPVGGSPKLNLQSRASSELDIRGYETLEAESVVENYIDSAVMAKLGTVTIIHGKGTGALRKAVHEMLKRNKAVKSFRLGRYGEGEAGVTVVELK
mgnify:CR=1 FL=1